MFKSLKKQILTDIAARTSRNEITEIDHYTLTIMSNRPDIQGADAEFYRAAAHKAIRDMVKACVGKYADSKPDHGGPLLPGFEYLQVAYTVEREGAVLLVPLDQLTDGELEARAAELDGMAKGCQNHAREIRAFVTMRSVSNDNAPDQIAA